MFDSSYSKFCIFFFAHQWWRQIHHSMLHSDFSHPYCIEGQLIFGTSFWTQFLRAYTDAIGIQIKCFKFFLFLHCVIIFNPLRASQYLQKFYHNWDGATTLYGCKKSEGDSVCCVWEAPTCLFSSKHCQLKH